LGLLITYKWPSFQIKNFIFFLFFFIFVKSLSPKITLATSEALWITRKHVLIKFHKKNILMEIFQKPMKCSVYYGLSYSVSLITYLPDYPAEYWILPYTFVLRTIQCCTLRTYLRCTFFWVQFQSFSHLSRDQQWIKSCSNMILKALYLPYLLMYNWLSMHIYLSSYSPHTYWVSGIRDLVLEISSPFSYNVSTLLMLMHYFISFPKSNSQCPL
jgi:hypothetical protein